MTIFSSRFDRARRYSEAYAGEAGETRFWTPATVAVAGVALGAAALIATDLAASPQDDADWGEGWDDHTADPGTHDTGAHDTGTDDGGAWSYHSDYTGASVGGEGDFVYFSDGDTSFSVG
jgi:hypothetical protein